MTGRSASGAAILNCGGDGENQSRRTAPIEPVDQGFVLNYGKDGWKPISDPIALLVRASE